MRRLYFILLLLLTTLGCNSAVKGLYPARGSEMQYEMYIVNNHWHTGMTLRAADLSPNLLKLTGRTPDSGWIDIGWGDDGFYRAKEVTTGISLQAMFCSPGSVLHVWTLPAEPMRFYEMYNVTLYRIHVSERGWAQLMKRLEESFARSPDGSSIRIQAGLFDNSDFYQAHGTYGMFHTCNHWMADTIRTTGFPISPFYSLTADNVGWQIEHFGREFEQNLVLIRQ